MLFRCRCNRHDDAQRKKLKWMRRPLLLPQPRAACQKARRQIVAIIPIIGIANPSVPTRMTTTAIAIATNRRAALRSVQSPKLCITIRSVSPSISLARSVRLMISSSRRKRNASSPAGRIRRLGCHSSPNLSQKNTFDAVLHSSVSILRVGIVNDEPADLPGGRM